MGANIAPKLHEQLLALSQRGHGRYREIIPFIGLTPLECSQNGTLLIGSIPKPSVSNGTRQNAFVGIAHSLRIGDLRITPYRADILCESVSITTPD